MAQQAKMIRVRALKMFKASIEGALPIMVNPGDVVDLDRFTAGMLLSAEKAELASDAKLFIQKDYVPPPRVIAPDLDPIGAIVKALHNLTEATIGRARQKGA